MQKPKNLTGLVEKPIPAESYIKWPKNHFLSLYFSSPEALRLRNCEKGYFIMTRIQLGQEKSSTSNIYRILEFEFSIAQIWIFCSNSFPGLTEFFDLPSNEFTSHYIGKISFDILALSHQTWPTDNGRLLHPTPRDHWYYWSWVSVDAAQGL